MAAAPASTSDVLSDISPKILLSRAMEAITGHEFQLAADLLELAIHANAKYLPALQVYRHLVRHQPELLIKSHLLFNDLDRLIEIAKKEEVKELIAGAHSEFATGTGLPAIPHGGEPAWFMDTDSKNAYVRSLIPPGDFEAYHRAISGIDIAYAKQDFLEAAACLQALILKSRAGELDLKFLLTQQLLLEKEPKTAFIFCDERPINLPNILRLIHEQVKAIDTKNRSLVAELKGVLRRDKKNSCSQALLRTLTSVPESLAEKVKKLREEGDLLSLARRASLKVPEAQYELGELLEASSEPLLAECLFIDAWQGGSAPALRALEEQKEVRAHQLKSVIDELTKGEWKTGFSWFKAILKTALMEPCAWLLLLAVLEARIPEIVPIATEEGWKIESIRAHITNAIKTNPALTLRDQSNFIRMYLKDAGDQAWRDFFFIIYSKVANAMKSEVHHSASALRESMRAEKNNAFLLIWTNDYFQKLFEEDIKIEMLQVFDLECIKKGCVQQAEILKRVIQKDDCFLPAQMMLLILVERYPGALKDQETYRKLLDSITTALQDPADPHVQRMHQYLSENKGPWINLVKARFPVLFDLDQRAQLVLYEGLLSSDAGGLPNVGSIARYAIYMNLKAAEGGALRSAHAILEISAMHDQHPHALFELAQFSEFESNRAGRVRALSLYKLAHEAGHPDARKEELRLSMPPEWHLRAAMKQYKTKEALALALQIFMEDHGASAKQKLFAFCEKYHTESWFVDLKTDDRLSAGAVSHPAATLAPCPPKQSALPQRKPAPASVPEGPRSIAVSYFPRGTGSAPPLPVSTALAEKHALEQAIAKLQKRVASQSDAAVLRIDENRRLRAQLAAAQLATVFKTQEPRSMAEAASGVCAVLLSGVS